jgi:hypothetical protein
MNIPGALTTCFGLLLLAVVLCTPSACTANRHNQITRAIESGADPLEAKCAIESEARTS